MNVCDDVSNAGFDEDCLLMDEGYGSIILD